MMNFCRMVKAVFVRTAGLAGIVITLFCLAAIAYPVFSIVGLITAFPAIAILACFVFRLPFPHTRSIAKMVLSFLNFRVFAMDFFTAIIAVNKGFAPLKQRKFAFMRTGYRVFPSLMSMWFNIYRRATNWASNDRIASFIGVFTIARAKPLARFIASNNGFLAVYDLPTIKTREFFTCASLRSLAPKRTIFCLSARQWFVTFSAFFHVVLPPIYNYTIEQWVIPCEQTGRQGRGMEIHPPYVAVTLQRLQDMGLEPRLLPA